MVESAQAAAGRAVARAVRGSVDYSDGSGSWKKMRVGSILKQGATIRTAAESSADLFLDKNGPVVRVTENSQLGLDRLSYESSSAEVIIDTGLNLKDGRILGNVAKMAQASKYEVKTPNGVAGIRGTEYDISANGRVLVITGSVVVVAGGQTFVVNAGEAFDPGAKAVSKADPQVVTNVGTVIKDVVTSIITPDGDVVVVVPQAEPPKDPAKTETDAVDNYRNTQNAGTNGG